MARDELEAKLTASAITHKNQIKTLVDRLEELKARVNQYENLGDIEQLKSTINEHHAKTLRIQALNTQLEKYKSRLDRMHQRQHIEYEERKTSEKALVTEQEQQNLYLQKQLKEAEAHMSEKQLFTKQLQGMVAELERLGNQVEIKDKEIDRINQDRHALLDLFKDEQKKLNNKIDALQYTIEQDKQQLEHLVHLNRVAETKEQQLKQQCSHQQETIQHSENEIKQLRKIQTNLENTLEEQKQRACNDIQSNNDKHQSELESVQQKERNLQNTIAELSHMLSGKKDEVSKLEQLFQQKLTDAITQKEQLEKQVVNLKDVEDELKSQLNTKMEEFNNRETHLLKEQEKLQHMYDYAMKRCEQQDVDLEELKNELEENRAGYRELEGKFDTAMGQIAMDAEREKRMMHLESTVETIQNNLNAAIDLKNKHETEAEQLKHFLQEVTAQAKLYKNDLEEALRCLDLEKSHTMSQADIYQEKLDRATNKITELKDEIKNWHIELRETEHKCARHRSEEQRLKGIIRLLMEYSEEALRLDREGEKRQ